MCDFAVEDEIPEHARAADNVNNAYGNPGTAEAEAEAEAERQVTSGGRARDARTQESSWVPSLSSQEDSGIEGTHVARLEWCVPAVLWAFLAVVQ